MDRSHSTYDDDARWLVGVRRTQLMDGSYPSCNDDNTRWLRLSLIDAGAVG
ncbi:MAG TPA: hypothetical protein VI837_06580 [Blastocatellia bacterium]|nr:hypothetical protein [Blastocatellia bacterium]